MMQRRYLWGVCLVLVVMLFSFAEVSHSYFQLYRIPNQMYQPPKYEQVDNFINALKAGNQNVFRRVEYSLLRGTRSNGTFDNTGFVGVMDKIMAESKTANKYFINWLTNDGALRNNVIRATLAGLLNMDPRVRTTAVQLLRRLRPDVAMQLAVKRALARETVAGQWEYWRVRNIDIPSSDNPWLEGTFWDEDPTFWDQNYWNNTAGSPFDNPGPYRQYSDRDPGTQDSLWGWQAGSVNNQGGSAFPIIQHTGNLEDTRHELSRNSPGFSPGNSQDNWADSAIGVGYQGAQVPVGGSWSRPDDDIKKYVGSGANRLKYEYLKFYAADVNVTDRSGSYGRFVEVYGNPRAELYKLDLFITRHVWYNKIKQGQLNSMVIVSKDTFKALFMSIDGESAEQIPYPSTATAHPLLKAEDIDVLIRGLLYNKVVSNRYVIAKAIKFIYRMADTPDAVKRKIIKAILKAKYQENEIDIYYGDDLYSELVGETTDRIIGGVTGELNFYLGLGNFNPDVDETDSPELPADAANRVAVSSIEFKNVQIKDKATGKPLTDQTGAPVLQKCYVANGELSHLDNMNNALINADMNVVDPEEAKKAQKIIDMFRMGTQDGMKDISYEDLRNAFMITLYRVQQDFNVTLEDVQEMYYKAQYEQDDALRQDNVDVLRKDYFSMATADGKSFPLFFRSMKAKDDAPAVRESMASSLRKNIINTALAGLQNIDPRVRLACIHVLRRCAPDESMMDAVKKAYEVETVDYDERLLISERTLQDDYGTSFGSEFIDRGLNEFVDIFGIVQNKEANKELNKLRRFIIRTMLVVRLENGSAGDLLAKVNRDQFSTLTEWIDSEELYRIPYRYLVPATHDPEKLIIKPHMVKYVVKGLENFNFLNQKETAEFVIAYYNNFVDFDEDHWRIDTASVLDKRVRNIILEAIINAIEDDIVIKQTDICSTLESAEGRAVINITPLDGAALDKILVTKKEWMYAKVLEEQGRCNP